MAYTDDIKNDPNAGTPELEEIREPDSAFKPAKGESSAQHDDDNLDAGEVKNELEELKDNKVDESAEKNSAEEEEAEADADSNEEIAEGAKTEMSANEKEDVQQLKSLSNTKKRSDDNGTQNAEKRKRQRRRNYDDVPKQESDSDDGEQDENEKEARNENDDLDEEEDDLVEVSESNIIPGGRRTRGKKIDYKKANEEVPLPDDDDDEDDEEFEDKGEDEEA